MILDDNFSKKPHIEYPCEWGYKIIGVDKKELEAVIFEVMGIRDYTISKANRSSKGKFHALTTSCLVASQLDRDSLFKSFQDHKDVKMVI